MRALVLLVAFAGCGADRLVQAETTLFASPAALDFQEVPVGLSVVRRVSLENRGEFSVTVNEAAINSRAFEGPLQPFTLAPGESVSLAFSFTPRLLGQATATATLKSSSAAPVMVPLRGVGVAAVMCGSCQSPPPNRCVADQTLIIYEPTGHCVDGQCAYTAQSRVCDGLCNVAQAACSVDEFDAGTFSDAGSSTVDAGALKDAGSSAVDAGPRDAGPPDAGFDAGLDAGPVDSGPHGFITWFDGGEYTWVPPAGVTKATFYGCGGGGAGGSVPGATGGGAACAEATFFVVPGRAVRARVASGGQQPGNGGGYTALYFTNAGQFEDFIVGGGGGGGNGCAGCAGHFGAKGGAGGAEQGKDGEVYFGSGTVCSTARGGLGGRSVGGPIVGAGGLGGESPSSGNGGQRCAGGFGSFYAGGCSKTVSATVCDVNGGAFMWREGGSEPGGGGAGGAGYFGGGGGGFVKGWCGGGGGGGSSLVNVPSAVIFEGNDQTPGFSSFGRDGAGRGGDEALTAASNFKGADGYILITW